MVGSDGGREEEMEVGKLVLGGLSVVRMKCFAMGRARLYGSARLGPLDGPICRVSVSESAPGG